MIEDRLHRLAGGDPAPDMVEVQQRGMARRRRRHRTRAAVGSACAVVALVGGVAFMQRPDTDPVHVAEAQDLRLACPDGGLGQPEWIVDAPGWDLKRVVQIAPEQSLRKSWLIGGPDKPALLETYRAGGWVQIGDAELTTVGGLPAWIWDGDDGIQLGWTAADGNWWEIRSTQLNREEGRALAERTDTTGAAPRLTGDSSTAPRPVTLYPLEDVGTVTAPDGRRLEYMVSTYPAVEDDVRAAVRAAQGAPADTLRLAPGAHLLVVSAENPAANVDPETLNEVAGIMRRVTGPGDPVLARIGETVTSPDCAQAVPQPSVTPNHAPWVGDGTSTWQGPAIALASLTAQLPTEGGRFTDPPWLNLVPLNAALDLGWAGAGQHGPNAEDVSIGERALSAVWGQRDLRLRFDSCREPGGWCLTGLEMSEPRSRFERGAPVDRPEVQWRGGRLEFVWRELPACAGACSVEVRAHQGGSTIPLSTGGYERTLDVEPSEPTTLVVVERRTSDSEVMRALTIDVPPPSDDGRN